MFRLVLLVYLTLFMQGCNHDKKTKMDGSSDESEYLAKVLMRGEAMLPYRIYSPEESGPFPLILFLHGAGERGDDNEAQLTHIAPLLVSDSIQMNYKSHVVFPQCAKDDYWAPVEIKGGKWMVGSQGDPTESMALVIELVRELRKLPEVDSNRVYVAGLSMGGFGTFDLIVRQPSWFAGAIGICGGGDLNHTKEMANTPLHIFHGDNDPVVPVTLSRTLSEKLDKEGAEVTYVEYQGVDHFSWDRAMNDPATLEWLFKQRNNKKRPVGDN